MAPRSRTTPGPRSGTFRGSARPPDRLPGQRCREGADPRVVADQHRLADRRRQLADQLSDLDRRRRRRGASRSSAESRPAGPARCPRRSAGRVGRGRRAPRRDGSGQRRAAQRSACRPCARDALQRPLAVGEPGLAPSSTSRGGAGAAVARGSTSLRAHRPPRPGRPAPAATGSPTGRPAVRRASSCRWRCRRAHVAEPLQVEGRRPAAKIAARLIASWTAAPRDRRPSRRRRRRRPCSRRRGSSRPRSGRRPARSTWPR